MVARAWFVRVIEPISLDKHTVPDGAIKRAIRAVEVWGIT